MSEFDIEQLAKDAGSGSPGVRPFGAAVVEEKDEIRNELVSQGRDPRDPRLIFEISRVYEERHRDDLKFSQRQDLARWLGLSWVAPRRSVKPQLTEEEIEYLLERLAGVNNPTGVSALTKLQAMRNHQ